MNLLTYLKYKIKTILALLLFTAILFGSFILYHLPLAAVIYPLSICVFLSIVLMVADYCRIKEKYNKIQRLRGVTIDEKNVFPDSESTLEDAYKDLIKSTQKELADCKNDYQNRYNDMVEYYTVWAHQIKTPIASMSLSLQNTDSPVLGKLKVDLNRIENYVNMVMTFLRFNSESNDYVFRKYKLDDIIRQALRKFSNEFIQKKLSLQYNGTDIEVLTDEKWILFVIEQILSNAIKYTNSGAVSVYTNNSILYIKDSGIGIAKEDLPRVFEKGYTGFNGRIDKKASGIGLYLCKRICDKLGHRIEIDSEPGLGTCVSIDLSSIDTATE